MQKQPCTGTHSQPFVDDTVLAGSVGGDGIPSWIAEW